MRKHSTHSISRVFFSLLMLMIAGVNLTMAQGLSSNDIKPKSVIRISLFRTAKRNPLIFPI